jgi:hypothetical protein
MSATRNVDRASNLHHRDTQKSLKENPSLVQGMGFQSSNIAPVFLTASAAREGQNTTHIQKQRPNEPCFES